MCGAGCGRADYTPADPGSNQTAAFAGVSCPPMRKLDGRVAVVTGAGSGIGRATALLLAERGCALALVDVNEAALAETAQAVRALGRKASVHVADVADRARMEHLPGEVLTEHGHVHVLVNNAGVSVIGTLLEQKLDDFAWLMGINFWGVVYGCKLFLPFLLAEDEAQIVNISLDVRLRRHPHADLLQRVEVRGARVLGGALVGALRHERRRHLRAPRRASARTSCARRACRATATRQDKRATIETFDRRAHSPEKAARKIVRAIERNQARVRIGPEAYLTDWAKRLFPVSVQRLVGWGWRRSRR